MISSPRTISPSSRVSNRLSTQRLRRPSRARAWESVAYIVLFALVAISVGIFLIWHTASLRQRELASWQERLSATSSDQMHSVTDWLTERWRDTHVLSISPEARSVLLADSQAGQHPFHVSAMPDGLLAGFDQTSKGHTYAGAYVLDRDARLVARSIGALPLSPLFSETCRAVLRTGDVRTDLVGDAPLRTLIGFGAPVLTDAGTDQAGHPKARVLGMVLLVSDSAKEFFDLLIMRAAPSQTAETLLVRRDGNDIVYFTPRRFFPAGTPYQRFPMSGAPSAARLALEGRKTFGEYNDYRGTTVLAATQYIERTGWGLVCKIDRTEALANYRHLAILESLAGGILVLFFGVLLMFLRIHLKALDRDREEGRFRTLLEAAPDAIYILDPSNLKIVGRNQRARELDGYTDDEIARMTAADLHPPDEYTALRERLHSGLVVGGNLPVQTLHYRRKNGQLTPVEESHTLVEAGGERLILSIVHDITDLKRAEDSLRLSEASLKKAHQAAQMGCWEWSVQTNTITWDENLYHLAGRDPKLPALQIHELDSSISPESRDQQAAFVENTLTTGTPCEYDLQMRHPDGSIRWVTVRANPLWDASGRIIGLRGSVQDITERKRVEETLRESEAHLREAERIAHFGSSSWDVATNTTIWSDELYSITGWDPSERPPTHQQRADLYSPESWARLEPAVQRVLATGEPYDLELEVVRPDGTRRQVRARGAAVRGGDGSVTRLHGTLQDITEQKAAHNAALEAEREYRKIYEGAIEGMFRTSMEGKSLSVNPALARMLGYNSPEEFVSVTNDTTHQVWLDPEVRARYAALLMEQGIARGFECQLRRNDGNPIWVSLNARKVCDTEGRVLYIEGFLEDITERKKSAEALQESEERFRTTFENAGMGMALVDLQGHLFKSNAALRKMLGYSEEELIGMTFTEFTHHDDRELDWNLFDEMVAGEYDRYEIEKQYLQKGGGVVWGLLTASLVKGKDGKPLYCVGMVQDITERKKSEQAFRESEERFRALFEQAPIALGIGRMGLACYANRAYLKMFGLRKVDDIVGRPIAEQWAPEYRTLIEERARERSLGLPAPVSYEAVGQRPDGSQFPVHIEVDMVNLPDGPATLAFLTDITERKRVEAALIEERNLLHTLMDNIPDHIYFKDRESRFTRINKAQAARFGFSDPAQALGKTDFDFFLPGHAQLAYEDEQEIIRTGKPMVGKEEREDWPDGHVTWVSTTKMPLRDAQGNITGTFGVSRDITERKRMEDALRESQALTDAIVDSTPDMIWSVDPGNFALLTFNRGLRDYYSQHRGIQLRVGMPQTELFTDQRYLDQWRQLYQRALAEGFYTTEYTPSQGAIILQLTFNLLKREGKVFGISVFGKDITERKQAEAALQESEERFRSLVENATVGIYRTTPEGRILMANPALIRMLGFQNFEELAVRNLEEEGFEPGYTRSDFHARMERDCEVKGLEVAWAKLNGEAIFVRESARAIRHKDGKILWYDGVVEDITAEKKAEAEHVRLVTAIEQSGEAVVMTNTNGDIEYVNAAFTRVTGYSREEILGQNPRVLKSGKHDQEFYQHLWQTILNGQIWRGEIVNQHKDGSLYTEQMTISPIVDERGQITHFVATKQDATERKSLEAQLQQAAKMEAVGRLAGGVAHDFNNLLTIINGYSELLLEKFAADPSTGGYLKEINDAGGRAASLTRQLLAFSRLQVLAPQVLDLNALVTNLEKMLRRLIGEDVQLNTLLDPALRRIKADPGQVEQVLMNLAVNARDAMPIGGYLTLETRNVELDDEYARNHPTVTPGPHVMVSVSDTGVGMTPETQARIFEPFFTTKGIGKGTGLGLATVYGIVKQSGGSIWVYSELGQGTVFKIYFPLIGESSPESELPKTAADLAAGTETVLMVEDEEGVRSLVRLALVAGGYDVLEADSAQKALAICANHPGPIHLLLTDVIMPEMSGPEVASKVAALRPGIRVLYMSGYTDDAVLHHGVVSQDMPFIQKPFSPLALRRKIREVLGGIKG